MKKLILTIMLSASTWIYAQEEVVVKDLETWTSLNLNYKINKKWSTAIQGQLRLDNNSSEVRQYFGQVDLEYGLSKHLDLVGALRYIVRNDHTGNVQGYENLFRYHFDAVYKHKLDRFSLKYRVRYQNRNEIDVEDSSKKYIRFKAGGVYNVRKWKLDPELSAEVFRSVGSESENQLDSYRITLGTRFKVHKSAKVKLFYRYDKQLNVNYPQTTNIIGVKYTYNLK